MSQDKDLILISAPKETPDLSIQPEYRSPWPDSRIIDAFTKVATDGSVGADEVMSVIKGMRNEFDQLLSAALYVIWSIDGEEYYDFLTSHERGIAQD